MAQDTPQSRAIILANKILAQAADLAHTKAALDAIVLQFNSLNLLDTLNAMPTCATNPNGSLGTVDASPVIGNVIDNRVMSSLSVAIAAFDLGALISVFQQVSVLLAGGVPQQAPGAPVLLSRAVVSPS